MDVGFEFSKKNHFINNYPIYILIHYIYFCNSFATIREQLIEYKSSHEILQIKLITLSATN